MVCRKIPHLQVTSQFNSIIEDFELPPLITRRYILPFLAGYGSSSAADDWRPCLRTDHHAIPKGFHARWCPISLSWLITFNNYTVSGGAYEATIITGRGHHMFGIVSGGAYEATIITGRGHHMFGILQTSKPTLATRKLGPGSFSKSRVLGMWIAKGIYHQSHMLHVWNIYQHVTCALKITKM